MKEVTMQTVPLAGTSQQLPAGAANKAGQTSGFKEILGTAIDNINGQLVEADKLAQGLAVGEHANIHETMIAMEKAGISFRLMTKVQQKAIDAYREVMRMQL